MYSWLWRRLPGGRAEKLVGSALLLMTALVLLFIVVFPYLEARLPFNQVTVDQPPPRTPPPSAAP